MSQRLFKSSLAPRSQPFLYLTSALAGGILADRYLEFGRPGIVVSAALAVAASVTLVYGKREPAASMALIISFAIVGALLSTSERACKKPTRLTTLYESRVITSDDPVELTGTLAAPPEPAPGAWYLDVAAESVHVGDEVLIASGHARLFISPFDAEAQAEFARLGLDYGSRIRVLVRLERARQYSNPGSPDFNEFLERQGFDLKGVIKSSLLIEHLGSAGGNPALGILYRLRLRLMAAINSSFNRRVAGTLNAMLTGNRYFLEQAAAERLREGATFHTLSISGMHIGIIAWALLGGGRALKRRNAARVIGCLVVLWAYAVMVGLAPPVSRATAMITIGLLGPLLFRRSASINTVALAAFIMLALEPALVADPAFQLSFIAVAAIVALALPVAERLREIGQWRPGSHTPHPPWCSPAVRYFAETIYWDDRAFREEMRRSTIRYRLQKAGAARVLGRLRLQAVVRGAVLLLITSSAIQLSTLPLMALYFNRVAPVGVLLNVIAGLLTGVLMLTSLAAIAVGSVSAWLASQLALVVNAAHYGLVNAIIPFVDLPLATFRVAHYEGSGSIVYALYFLPLGLLGVLIDRWRPVDKVLAIDWISKARFPTRRESATSAWPRRVRLAPLLLCALALIMATVAVIKPPLKSTDGKLTVYFLDVGQGDCAFVVFPHGKTMLIDAGGELRFDSQRRSGDRGVNQTGEDDSEFADNAFSIGEAVVSRFIWSLGRTKVDYVLATHAHADHIGGLSDVVRNFEVRQAIVGYATPNDSEYERFASAARRRGNPLYAVSAGEKFEIDGVSVEVLWPPPARGPELTSGNNDSVVLRLVYGSVSILLAGDIEERAEDSLVASAANLRADLLKVPHHGSKTSSTEAFINAVKPRYAVISVGERSRFGHPHPAVVSRYLTRGVKLFQTGRDGMVTVQTDGASLDIQFYRKETR